MSVNVFNRCWSKVILETLIHRGVTHFCIAPGSRSTPLTLEAIRLQNAKRATCHSHFDERGLGFFALGLAKASNRAVAIIVTSGTATANLYPAVVEARQAGVNLILLTADRPPELLECGANQAILQQNMFAHYPLASINLPRPSQDYQANWLISVIDQACHQQANQQGVIHINVPFAEPLYEARAEEIDNHPWLSQLQSWFNQRHSWVDYQQPMQEVSPHKRWDYWRSKKGVIAAGKLPPAQASLLHNWAVELGWILITDIQSNVKASLPHADLWLANPIVKEKLLSADILIQFGSHFVSKRVNQFLNEFNGEYWIVEQRAGAVDPNHRAHCRFNVPANDWLQAHATLPQQAWSLEAQALSEFCIKFVEQQIGNNLNEASLAHQLNRLAQQASACLFLGNSLFVRLADALAKLSQNIPVYTNRGASGIDGLIATTAGLSLALNQPVISLIGDISTLHDLNSLALLKKVNQPCVLFVINNNGGAIFDVLPVQADVKDQYYRLPHNTDFSHIATMFDVKYVRPYTWADLNMLVKQALVRREATIIEIKVNPSDGSDIYKLLLNKISQAKIG